MIFDLDTEFDVYSDTPMGKDPDSFSPTLRRYHQMLWSKPLPGGAPFTLEKVAGRVGLVHRSELGEFSVSSDAIGHTYRSVKSMAHIIAQVDERELDGFYRLCSTIGAYVVFPSNRIDGKRTINGARGMDRRISDRFDLTLECIRRSYRGEDSPLSQVFDRYQSFFALFGDFAGYCSFFLLDDAVSPEADSVRFFLPFRGFGAPALPQTIDQYHLYRSNLSTFVGARNQRMREFASSQSDT